MSQLEEPKASDPCDLSGCPPEISPVTVNLLPGVETCVFWGKYAVMLTAVPNWQRDEPAESFQGVCIARNFFEAAFAVQDVCDPSGWQRVPLHRPGPFTLLPHQYVQFPGLFIIAAQDSAWHGDIVEFANANDLRLAVRSVPAGQLFVRCDKLKSSN